MSNNAKFKCDEETLYQICENTWKLCESYLTEFSNYSSLYDAAHIQHNLQQVTAARELKSQKERNAQAKAARQELKTKLPAFFNLHTRLVGYIHHLYSPNIAATHAKSTLGLADMSKAKQGNWVEIATIIAASISYISANEVQLIADARMPTSFLADFQAYAQSMQAIQNKITSGENNAILGTSNKREANNLIYGKFTQLIDDAHATFMPDNAVLTLFSFAYQKRQLVSTKTAGINATVIDAATKKFLANATITIQDPNNAKTGVSDAKGKCKIIQVPANTYNILVEADGYEPLLVTNFKIKLDTVSRFKPELKALEAK